jgi:hypothetical protein
MVVLRVGPARNPDGQLWLPEALTAATGPTAAPDRLSVRSCPGLELLRRSIAMELDSALHWDILPLDPSIGIVDRGCTHHLLEPLPHRLPEVNPP